MSYKNKRVVLFGEKRRDSDHHPRGMHGVAQGLGSELLFFA